MADTEVVGKDYVFYVAASGEPATPDEIANYTDVGMIDEWEFSLDSDRIPVTHKGTSGFRTNLPGPQGYTITASGTYARDSEAGATILEAAAKATAAASKLVGWLNTTNVTGDRQKRGTAYVVAYSETHPSTDISRWTVTLEGDGDYVEEAVDA
jgi:hypothetical protein